MKFSYRLVNVFTQHAAKLSGNPLCVFEDAGSLNDAQMQALALQFNLSETTFIFPSKKADARVRIFTPDYEMPFAGHPTLGTAYVVRSLKSLSNHIALELNVGIIPVTQQGVRFELRANDASTRMPSVSKENLATALGIRLEDISGEPLWVNAGSEQLIVPLASEEAVRRIRINVEALQGATHDGPRAQVYVFASTGPDTVLSRFFFSKGDALVEDPATGSAAANLGGWYLANHIQLPTHKTISQGAMVSRPSTLQLRIDAERNVFVAGDVIELGRGFVELES